MKPDKYFQGIIKNKRDEMDSGFPEELARREVETIFFFIKNFLQH